LADNKEIVDDQVSRFWVKVNLVAEISSFIRKSPPVKETYKKVLEMIQGVVPFESSTLSLFNKKKERLEEMITIGRKVELLDFVQFEAGSGISAWVAKQKRPIILSHLKNLNRPPEEARNSFLIIPLNVEDRLIGVINLSHSAVNFFRENDIKLLEIVGDQIAISIERLMYQKELEKKNKALVKAQKELKEVHKALIDGEKLSAVKELAVSINHEINNPLSVIIGNIQYLRHIEKNLDEKLAERLGKIESECMRIAEVNRRLLKIEDLVSETYIYNGQKIKMINLQKSTTGV
jgi:transcriptional regulator with GAF, ATPase, and Fis domain